MGEGDGRGALSGTDCDAVLQQVELYLDGELGLAAYTELEVHLTGCGSCMERVEFRSALRRIVASKCGSEAVPGDLMMPDPRHLGRPRPLRLNPSGSRRIPGKEGADPLGPNRVKGTRPGHLPPPSIRSERADRACAGPGARRSSPPTTSGTHCWQHTELTFPNYRGKRLARGET